MDQPTDNVVANERKIAYLLRMYPRFSQTFVVNEILELERQGVSLGIVSLRKPDEGMFHDSVTRVSACAQYLPETGFSDARRHVLSQWGALRRFGRRYWNAVRLVRRYRDAAWFDLVRAVHLVNWARKNQVSHVHVHFGTDEATVALLANEIGGLSYSMTLHAFDIFKNDVDRELLARKINQSAFTVTVCESNRRFMAQNLPNLNTEKIRVNYNGIDISRFEFGTKSREPNSIFSVGRLIEKKGFLHLVRATALLRDRGLRVMCRIAGEGREEKNLRREIASRNLEDQVLLLGPVRQEEVREWMQRAACFVLPCVEAKDGNVDALPTVLLESLACGCPSVSTRLSGIPEIIEDGVDGVLVEPGDETALAQAIERLLTNSELSKRLSLSGRKTAEERFNVTRNVSVMRNWLCDSGRPTPHDSIARSSDGVERAASSPVLVGETAGC